MLVIAVGPNSEWGQTMALVAGEAADTPLQAKLTILAGAIGKVGLAVALLCFVVLMIRWVPFLMIRWVPFLMIRWVPFLMIRWVPFLMIRWVPFLMIRWVPFLMIRWVPFLMIRWVPFLANPSRKEGK
jgi:hypothetical protein